MADERDPKVSQRYRELGAEEPSRELDQAVLAAAHRAAGKPHAPLVTPSGRHRWYFSLGAAAVIVLAVAVTYQMQQEVPDPDSIPIPAAPEEQRIDMQAKPYSDKLERSPAAAKDAAKPSAKPEREAARKPEAPGARSDSAPTAASRAETAGRAESPAERRQAEPEMRARRDAAPAEPRMKQPAPAAAPAPPSPELGGLISDSMRYEPPERWLERIVQLRKEGKHDEADKLLAEFRRRFPDYRIPENVVRP